MNTIGKNISVYTIWLPLILWAMFFGNVFILMTVESPRDLAATYYSHIDKKAPKDRLFTHYLHK